SSAGAPPTRSERRSAPDRAPDDDAAAEAHPAHAEVADPRRPPELELAAQRVLAVEALDAGAEEAAGVGPAARVEAAERRQADPGVEAPGPEREAPGDAELEAGDAATGAN